MNRPRIPGNQPLKQQGFALLETSIAIFILFWSLLSVVKTFNFIAHGEIARLEGNKVAKYNHAVASYVSNEPARRANLAPAQPFPLPMNNNGIG